MAVRIMSLLFCTAVLCGCECRSRTESESESLSKLPSGFDQVMADHAALSVVARNALIEGNLPVARQAMRKLAFLMENVPYPAEGEGYARITQELASQVRAGTDLEEACMAFARLSYACGQCHHALDRGPPIRLDPAPQGKDITMHMRRHYRAVERMWEALLTDSPRAFQRAARVLAEAPLLGEEAPDTENPSGTTRLAYEVHDLAFAAAVEGSNAADEYVPAPGEPREDKPTTRGQAEIFGRILATCSQCHMSVGVNPRLAEERPQGSP